MPGTSGIAYPTQVCDICAEMKRCYPNVRWWLHFHNTRGLGNANILAGMQAGFTQYDASFASVVGCSFVPAPRALCQWRMFSACATK